MVMANENILGDSGSGDVLNLEAFRRTLGRGGGTPPRGKAWPGRHGAGRREPRPAGPPPLPWSDVRGWLLGRLADHQFRRQRQRRSWWRRLLTFLHVGAR
jgi:hypothetical protein